MKRSRKWAMVVRFGWTKVSRSLGLAKFRSCWQDVRIVAKAKLELKKLGNSSGSVAYVTLSRPDASNAMDGEMIAELTAAFEKVQAMGLNCRALILRGEGKNFCAGADLEWMKRSKDLSLEENRREAQALSRMFHALYELETPTIAVVHGAAYGGAVGLAACCDYVIAHEKARFCLSEVKVGLVAAVILPFLHLKIHAGFLRRFVLGATVFDGEEARHAGLVQLVDYDGDLEKVLKAELASVLAGEPHVQRAFKKNHRRLLERDAAWWEEQSRIGIETIAAARVSPTGQEGINAFFEKRKPSWVVSAEDKV